MNIDIRMDDKIMTVYFEGEIDHHASEKIRGKIDEQIEEKMPEKVCFDLSAVTFMDSSGIGLIMGRYKKLTTMGSPLVVKSVATQVERMIAMSGIDKLVKVV